MNVELDVEVVSDISKQYLKKILKEVDQDVVGLLFDDKQQQDEMAKAITHVLVEWFGETK